MSEYTGNNRRNGDAVVLDLRAKVLGVSRDLLCLKEQVERYIPILQDLAERQHLYAVIIRTCIVTMVIVSVTGLTGFLGYAILERLKVLLV